MINLLLKATTLARMPAATFAEPVIVPSVGSVSDTVERLKAEDAGAEVFSVIDFGSGVRASGLTSENCSS